MRAIAQVPRKRDEKGYLMNFFDPRRERLPNGLPMYYDDFGPVAAIPRLMIEPLLPDPEHGGSYNKVRLSVTLLDRPNSGSWYEIEIFEVNLPLFLRQWRDNPEEVFRRNFKWPGMMREVKGTEKSILTAEMLGKLRL